MFDRLPHHWQRRGAGTDFYPRRWTASGVQGNKANAGSTEDAEQGQCRRPTGSGKTVRSLPCFATSFGF